MIKFLGPKIMTLFLFQKPGTTVSKLRFGENELKFMDESSAVTLPSPLDVLDESVVNDNSSGISISDFRMEFKDLAELGKINSFDVGCQQETQEHTNGSENEDCSTNSPLLEPLLRKHLQSVEGSSNPAYTQSRPYLYGKQIHSLKQNDISSSPKIYQKPSHEEELMNARNVRAPTASPTPFHHAHYEHHHHFKQNEDLSDFLFKNSKNNLNGLTHKQFHVSETSKCNNFPIVPNDFIKSSNNPQGRVLPNISNYRCHKQKGSSVDGKMNFLNFICELAI